KTRQPLAGRSPARGQEITIVTAQPALLIAELPGLLQTIKVSPEGRVKRRAINPNHVQECVRSNAAIARVGNGRANQPHRPAVLAARVLLALARARRHRRHLTRKAWNRINGLLKAL